jgi:hypothetical protein
MCKPFNYHCDYFSSGNRSNKAVADGAVSFYIDHLVSSRVARATYGIECSTQYDSLDPEHLARESKSYINVAGVRRIPGYFESILRKVNIISLLIRYMLICFIGNSSI